MGKTIYIFNKQKLVENKLLDLFLALFDYKAHLSILNGIEIYTVSCDEELETKCCEIELAHFIFTEGAFELFTLEEMIAFGDLNKNLHEIDNAVFKKFADKCLDTRLD